MVHASEASHHNRQDKPDQGTTSGSEADSEAESVSSNKPPAKRSKSQTRRAPHQKGWCVPQATHLNPAPEQWAPDIAGMPPQLLQHLQQLLNIEAQRRAQPGPQPQASNNLAAEETIPGFGDLSNPGAALG